MMKPKIAVSAMVYTDNPTPLDYLRALETSGGWAACVGNTGEGELPFVLNAFDGLLLTGGNDISGERFGQPTHPKAELCAQERDATELLLARAFFKAGKPILGVCRGVQVLNVALGGTLQQHVYDCPHVVIDHKNRETRHEVLVVPSTLLASIFPGQGRLRVNSTHHQAVGRPASMLKTSAYSTDGIIEAVEYGSNVLGLQWHPERLLNEGMRPVFDWFVRVCAK